MDVAAILMSSGKIMSTPNHNFLPNILRKAILCYSGYVGKLKLDNQVSEQFCRDLH